MRSPVIVAMFSAILALGFLVSSVSSANAETIVTNLTVGSRGAEVSTLQQVLVSGGYLVMPYGVSYGYFGFLTRAAVAKWQRANGVAPALGYFGPISRAVFAKQASPASPTSSVKETSPSETPISFDVLSSTDTPHALGMRANRIMLFRAFPFEVRSGDIITLDGSGFSKTLNKVYFDGGNPVKPTSSSSVFLEITEHSP